MGYLETTPLTIDQNGYVMVYVSNESDELNWVHFDDFAVTHAKTPIVQVDDYYPFGLTFNSFTRSYSEPQKYKYNGKEEQEEWGVGVLDYGARYFDAAIARFINTDPAADNYQSWTPYHYVMNNPIKFIDPTGMFTELFNEDGKKVGEDKNGNDGNVSIVSNEVAKSVTDGDTSVDDAIANGTQTTKTVLTEALDVLGRTENNGGLREESSIVGGNGEIVRGETGSAESEIIDGKTVITSNIDPGNLDKSESSYIHSHQTEVSEDANGNKRIGSAMEPGPLDPSNFKDFKTNIIVGRLGMATGNADGSINKPKLGAVFYNKQGEIKSSVTKSALKRISK